MRLVGGSDRDLPAAAGKRRRNRQVAIESADVIDSNIFDLGELIVSIRHHALLEVERYERHQHANREQRRDDSAKGNSRGLHRGELAFTRKTLYGKQRPKQQRHRNHEYHIRRQGPEKDRQRRPEGRMLVADELADVENLGRRKDQHERRKPEDERPGELRQHVPIENRESHRLRLSTQLGDELGLAGTGRTRTVCTSAGAMDGERREAASRSATGGRATNVSEFVRACESQLVPQLSQQILYSRKPSPR